MSIWEYIHQNLKQSEIEILYKNYEIPFIVEVREQSQRWIEENLINLNGHLDPDNSEHYTTIFKLLHGLILDIEGRIVQLQSTAAGTGLGPCHGIVVRLMQTVNIMKAELAVPQRILTLFRQIRRILNMENAYVQHAMMNATAAASQYQSPSPVPIPMTIDQSSSPIPIPRIQSPRVQGQVLISSAGINGHLGTGVNGALSPPPQSPSGHGYRPISPGSSDIKKVVVPKPVFPQIGQRCIELKTESESHLVQLFRCICEKREELIHEIQTQKELKQTLEELLQDGKNEKAKEIQSDLNARQPAYQNNNKMLMYFIKQYLDKIKKVLADSSDLIENEIIKKELESYKREPNLSSKDLDVLQGYCSTMAEILIHCCDQLKKLQSCFQNHIPELSTLQVQFANLHAKFIKASFIIEEQPSQMIKEGTKFQAKLRLMAGTRNASSDQVSIEKVTALIVTKAEARKLVGLDASSNILQCVNAPSPNSSPPKTAKRKCTSQVKAEVLEIGNENGKKVLINTAGIIENNEEPLVAQNAFLASFQKPIIKSRFQRDKEAGKSILDVPYWILFHTEVTDTLNNGLVQKRWLWTLSSALKVHTHAGQKSQAFETIIWVNAMDPDMVFADTPTPKALPWEYVIISLNKKCLEMTKVPLTNEQKEYLKKKAFSVPLTNGYRPPEGYLTLDQFCKTNFRDCSFTFWRWFYEIMKLTEKHLCGPWADGYIAGFISREDAALKLMATCTTGTFIPRFSDSVLGGLAIVWLLENGTTASIAPSTMDELTKLPLAQRISDFSVLSNVYKQIEDPNSNVKHISLEPKSVFMKYIPKKTNGPDPNKLADHYVNFYLHAKLKVPQKSSSPRGSIFGTPPSTPYSCSSERSSSMSSNCAENLSLVELIADIQSIDPDEFTFVDGLDLSSDDDPMCDQYSQSEYETHL